ncbi:NAD-dependent epimerase [Niabella ginsengisoli]|uniref:NAD-dependent epimerase n=1 Tax=Niabella ginsengisoli TaxID=522298 RepID=A0ABS9SLS3_9BACT|nr:NAD-dependent epimerase [Niabella ginsengisoli]MCH5599297.1 NAD-dependent epimerase [Niabella ginsengisoli]
MSYWSAGFIGFHLVQKLISNNVEVIGMDVLNDYYDVKLKEDRLKQCGINIKINGDVELNQSTVYANYSFKKIGLEDCTALEKLFEDHQFDMVCHLAAQTGARHSVENPHIYMASNVVGFLNVLELCKAYKIKHLIYASSSSVYGLNENVPYKEESNTVHPVSLYAATKKSNELMAHVYSSIYGLPTTGLRFFTVYGPWGRPDMSPFLFTKAILEGSPINIFNEGDMIRDFTYIDDIVEGIYKTLLTIPQINPEWNATIPDPSYSKAPYKIYNIGNGQPIKLMNFIEELEQALNTKALKNMLPMQPGDVYQTNADCSKIQNDISFSPNTNLKIGIKKFVDWYIKYYNI